MKQVKIKKRQSEYCIAKNFYSKLTIYIVSMIVLIIFLAFFISGFAYLAGIPFESFPEDACINTSDASNYIYCLLIQGKDSQFYDLLYYFFIILIVVTIMAIIIFNVIYIVNKFFFVRLVKEKSCGAVIYKIENGKIYYLLLKMNFGHTSLCKGHQENGESDEETALREIKEETSLDVKLNTDFKTQIRYSPKELTLKDVYFFLATPINNDSTPVDEHDDEVDAFEWCNYEDALFKITYDSDRSVIKKADRYIKKHNLIE